VGVAQAAGAAFVLVAGGLGERLGYSGIKVALPTESATGTCYLQLYCESILALQARAGGACGPLPLAIMTSGDTHERTAALLRAHDHFGLQPEQVTLLKQEKVPCLADNEARVALDGKDAFAIQTKPHGHGDVHALLHASGLAAAWLAAGRRWVVFFQDTNALVFKAIPAALGVSQRSGFDVNSLCVPRKAKEAIGAITRLTRADGSAMTVNVEYNQLDPLLRASGFPDGDANEPATGYSPFPGNINQLVFALAPYCAQLAATGGGVAEFVNPKYTDASKTAFKSSTRLECMMQDYAKTVPPATRVGFTVIKEVWVGYSPVKNSVADALAKVASGCPPHSAAAGECDMYGTACRSLAMAGAQVAPPTAVTFAGTPLELWPRVVLSPATAATLVELRERAVRPSAGGVRISGRSALVLRGDVILEELDLDGALVITAAPGATVRVRGLRVANAGWDWVALTAEEEASAPEEQRIRGFKVVRHAAEEHAFTQPGEHVLSSA
jgi:UDP-sugar pyrophosphorylase